MNRISITLGIVLAALVAESARAQGNVARFSTHQNRIYTAFGLDPALVTTVGYGRVVPVFGHQFQLAGDVAVAWSPWTLRNLAIAAAEMDTRDFRARLQALTSIVHWRSLHLTGSATFITRGTENSVYRGLNFGSDFTGTAGVYRPGWFVAGEFGFDKAIISHITHSDWYRRYFYPDAKDGWYLNAGGTFHYGATAGVAIGPIELAGRFGWLRTEDFNDLVPPMFASLGVGVGF
jgi:hypothetical protein